MTVLVYHHEASNSVKLSGDNPDLIFEINFLSSLLVIRISQGYVECRDKIVACSVDKLLRSSDL